MPGFCSAQLRQSLFLQHLSSEVMGFSRAGSCSFSLHCLHLPSGVSLMRDHPLNGSSFRCLPTEFYCMESSLGAGRGWGAHSKQVPLTRPSVQFSSVQSVSFIRLFATPWTAAHQGSLSITNSQSLLKLMSIKSVTPSNHPSHPSLLLLPSIFLSIRVFSNE